MTTEHPETALPARSRFFTLLHRDDLMLYNVEIAIASGIYYAPVAPLYRLIGLSPGYARTSLKNTSNTILYGTTHLLPPGTSTTSRLYLRADRMWMYLYRANTNHMKRGGLVEEAKRLIAKQVEWMKMLNCYESHGLAVKPGHAAVLHKWLQKPLADGGKVPRLPAKCTTADALLAQQIEWAQALYEYETKGIAVKRGRAMACMNYSNSCTSVRNGMIRMSAACVTASFARN